MLHIQTTSCCAVRDVDGIDILRDPVKIMHSLLKREHTKKYDTTARKWNTVLRLFGFYIFTAVVRIKDGKVRSDYKAPRKLGDNFAAFLRANKLGTVTRGPAGPNLANHPKHFVRIYIWKPNPAAVEKWWDANKDRYRVGDTGNIDYGTVYKD